MAASRLPLVSVKALLQSMIPALVIARSWATVVAVISAIFLFDLLWEV